MRILVTGFGRFPGAPTNPSGALAQGLARRRRPAFSGLALAAHVFPTSYAAVDRALPQLIAQHRPDAILMFGLAGRTRHLRIETQARNEKSLVFPDVDRVVPLTARILLRAPAAMRGRAAMMPLLAAARSARVKAALSRDAGRYLCNYIYWRTLEAAQHPRGPRLVVFVHVPQTRILARPVSRKRRTVFADVLRAGEAILAALAAQRINRPTARVRARARRR
jgi:pyroglutamyl-peptidase